MIISTLATVIQTSGHKKKPMKKHHGVKFSKLSTRKIKRFTTTFQDTTVNASKIGQDVEISIDKAKEIIRKITQTAVLDVTKPLNRQLKKIYNLFCLQPSRGGALTDTIFQALSLFGAIRLVRFFY